MAEAAVRRADTNLWAEAERRAAGMAAEVVAAEVEGADRDSDSDCTVVVDKDSGKR